jgi:hypothetical protein
MKKKKLSAKAKKAQSHFGEAVTILMDEIDAQVASNEISQSEGHRLLDKAITFCERWDALIKDIGL